MNRHLRLSLALLAMGTSCTADQSISDELAKLKGQPVGNVTARLGNPESQQLRPGGAIYLWTYSVRVQHAPVLTSQTDYGSGRPSTYETMSYSDLPLTQYCSLRVVADGANTITEATHSGSNAACASMVQQLAEPQSTHRLPDSTMPARPKPLPCTCCASSTTRRLDGRTEWQPVQAARVLAA